MTWDDEFGSRFIVEGSLDSIRYVVEPSPPHRVQSSRAVLSPAIVRDNDVVSPDTAGSIFVIMTIWLSPVETCE